MEHFRKITDFVSILTLDLEVNFDFHSVLIISFFSGKNDLDANENSLVKIRKNRKIR